MERSCTWVCIFQSSPNPQSSPPLTLVVLQWKGDSFCHSSICLCKGKPFSLSLSLWPDLIILGKLRPGDYYLKRIYYLLLAVHVKQVKHILRLVFLTTPWVVFSKMTGGTLEVRSAKSLPSWYDTFSVVVECWVSFWSDFQSGSRGLKKVL